MKKLEKLRALEQQRQVLREQRDAGQVSHAEYQRLVKASWEETKLIVMTRKDIRRKSIQSDEELI